MITSKKALAITLSRLKRFEKPKMGLEQYSTPSEAAAIMLWDAMMKGHITDQHVTDLGAGTGILGIGALLLGASQVTFIETDPEAINTLKDNLTRLELTTNYRIIEADITDIDITTDTIIMNPPFGTKTKHADTEFLSKAFASATHIYSLHKSSTDNYIQELSTRHTFKSELICRFSFKLTATMNAHRKKEHPVEITCWHLSKDPTKDL